jgi:hypothetical protein
MKSKCWTSCWAVGDEFDTDWQAAVLNKSAMQVEHNLSLSGGTENQIYLRYNTQEGVSSQRTSKI